jgi:transcription initiation factor TFIID subunit 5
MADVNAAVTLSSSALPSTLLYTVLNSYGNVNNVSMSANGAQVAVSMNDAQIRLYRADGLGFGKLSYLSEDEEVAYNANSSHNAKDIILHGHSGSVYATDFSPDDKYLISCSKDNTVRLWDLQLGSNIVCYKAHTFPVWDVVFSPFGYYFASASHDGTARLWSTDKIYPVCFYLLRVFCTVCCLLIDLTCCLFSSVYLLDTLGMLSV